MKSSFGLGLFPVPSARLRLISNSLTDQALAVGGTFLANVALARASTKEEYGMFVLFYSIFTFLSLLQNAAILEPFTVYGSGRYREYFPEYLRLMARNNFLLSLVLTAGILFLCLVFHFALPRLESRALIGLGLTIGVLLSGIFIRRAFYVHRQAIFAAKSSLAFFVTVAAGLWFASKLHVLDSLSVFLILALGWVVPWLLYGKNLPLGRTRHAFLTLEPDYWAIHWKYARWVLMTAFVFQLMTQGYYWLVAAFLSAREVAELRAMYNLVTPVDQIFIAMGYLVLPVMASYYARNRMDRVLSLWKRYALAILGVTGVFALALRFLGQRLMHSVYAGKYDGLASLLFLLGLLPVLMSVGNTMTHALNAVEKPKLVFYGFFSSGAATIVLGIPLVIQLGLRGAVYGMLVSGTVFSTALVVGFLTVFHKKSENVPIEEWSGPLS